ncbi:esterase-like activity of phytase family protein [Sphingomonas sanxanigenens]|uniref:Phytase-like domain-containing protein n=1 Tax=Sphingomonas sanxanigenens DSM 19645 = NX02 TaxID=1123269 RepID=W0AFT0_9SPHN|nr:esterase-like activity of phytase family protein [Sphingomonas sanxanigenens]AHE56769.1 hypothetical protein NX02_25820 [Sphingomonas sanxanigenens DSM 19645 = NX02]
MLRRLLPASLLLPLALARSAPGPMPVMPDQPIHIRATPVALDSADPARRDVGRLRYLGGWSLTSDERWLGGLSGAAMAKGEIVAVSDAGALLRIGIEGGKPDGRGHILPLPPGCGDGALKRDRDAEALTGEPGTNRIWISLERRNAICRLNGLRHAEAEVFPPQIADWPESAGGEALLRTADGRFLLWSESPLGRDRSYRLLRFDRDPAASGVNVEEMGWRAPPGYRPVEAAALPDGRMIVLHRRFTFLGGFSAVLTIVDPARLVAGRIVEPEEVARFEGSLIRDNYEALAVSREGGRTIVWIMSDDNFHFLERTLLLKFALTG